MLKDELYKARKILPKIAVGLVALAWLIAPVGVGNVVSLTSSAEAQATRSVSKSGPEAVREAFRSVLERQMDTAARIGSTAAQEDAARGLEMLEQMTSEDLAMFEQVGLEDKLLDLAAKHDTVDKRLEKLEKLAPNLAKSHNAPLFDAVPAMGDCATNSQGSPAGGPDRSDANTANALLKSVQINATVLLALEDVLDVAEAVRDGASRVCDEVIVAIGVGGNTSLACLVADVVYFVAKGVFLVDRTVQRGLEVAFENRTFCDATIDAAEIEATYERANNIYDQNEVHDAAAVAALAAHDAEIKAALAAHDAEIKAALAAHDAEIKALLANIQAGVDTNGQLLITPQGKRPGWNQ